jgi:hypothetical protein
VEYLRHHRKPRPALQVIKVDVVAHVLLAGINEGLVVPGGAFALGQSFAYQATPALAG